MVQYLNRTRIMALCAATVFMCPSARAERLRFDSFDHGTREITVAAAYGANHKIPDATKDRISFDLLRLRVGQFISPKVELAGELATGKQIAEPENFGWSVAAAGRYYIAVRGSTAIACDMTFGLTKFQRQLISQSTRINFTEQLGFAFQFGAGPSSAVTLEYKFSHNSNAGLKFPNLGINASIVSLGFSWYK